MASISSRRIANSLTWTVAFTTRSRTVGFSYVQTEHPRHHHRSPPSSSRTFSTAFTNSAEAAAQAAPPIFKPFNRAPYNAPAQGKPSHEAPPPTARTEAANPPQEPIREYSHGLSDALQASGAGDGESEQVDWTRSFHGLSAEAFSPQAAEILMQRIEVDDIEVKPEGLIYLPEIKYRRVLNRAFGPGGWGLAPRGETIVTSKSVTREYALVVGGRLVSISRGEQDYFDPEGIPTATEGCKSNALMRCCKDLGIASELWDPRYVRKFLASNAKEVWVEHVVTKRRKKIFMRKDDDVRYPFKEAKGVATGAV